MTDAILLDTCALLWLGFGDSALSDVARKHIEESAIVYVSPISLWEIANKFRLGKLQLKLPPRVWFAKMRERYQLTLLELTDDIMFRAAELPEIHKDPADRMIIASAVLAGLPVVTSDRNFPLYGIKTIS